MTNRPVQELNLNKMETASRLTSMKTRGKVTGKFLSLQVPESGPPDGNDTCDLWSAESTFFMV